MGYASVILAIALVAVTVLTHAAWYLRALVFLPVAMAAFGFLQASRHTCVARAREGTFERDDFSKTKAGDEDAAASLKVARGIERDALLWAVGCAVLAAATVYVH